MYNQAEYMRKRRDAHMAWMIEQKDQPCSRCGGTFPHYVMDWHHTDPSQKTLNIGRSILRKLTVLEAEIAKCVLLCANCHRIVEHSD